MQLENLLAQLSKRERAKDCLVKIYEQLADVYTQNEFDNSAQIIKRRLEGLN